MCDPISIGAALLSVGGTIANSMGANQAQKARDSAVAAETARQTGYQQQAEQAFQTTDKGFDRSTQDQAQGSLNAIRDAVIQGTMTPVANPTEGVSKSAPRVVGDTVTGAQRAGEADASAQGAALSRLGSFGDLMAGNKIALGRGAQQQDMLTGFSQGSENVLPLELQAANRKGAGLRGFGQILSGIGSAAGLAGGFGGVGNIGPTGMTYANELRGGYRPI